MIAGTRQYNGELGKFAGERIDIDRATMLFDDDVVAHRQSQPGAFAGRLGRKERVEHLFLHVRRYARAVVADSDLDMVSATFCRCAHDRLERSAAVLGLALGDGVEAVRDQIEEYPGDLLRKDVGHTRLGIEIALERDIEM